LDFGWSQSSEVSCSEDDRWHCYFLPPTSCKAPPHFRNCTNEKKKRLCTDEDGEPHYCPAEGHLVCPPGYSEYAAVAASGEERVRTSVNDGFQDFSMKGEPWEEMGVGLAEDGRTPVDPPVFPGGVSTRSHPGSKLWVRTQQLSFLSRLNWETRRRVEERVQGFLAAEGERGVPWAEGDACAAVHMRRGDKLTGQESWDAHDPRHYQIKGFNITIDEYVEKAAAAMDRRREGDPDPAAAEPTRKHIFFLTDDPEYVVASRGRFPLLDIHVLERATKKSPGDEQPDYEPDEDLIDVHGEEDGRKFIAEQNKRRVMDVVDLYASFALAKRCDTFVGNFESNVSNLAYQFMCFLRGRCPRIDWFGQYEGFFATAG
jgi:hypothetical protein